MPNWQQWLEGFEQQQISLRHTDFDVPRNTPSAPRSQTNLAPQEYRKMSSTTVALLFENLPFHDPGGDIPMGTEPTIEEFPRKMCIAEKYFSIDEFPAASIISTADDENYIEKTATSNYYESFNYYTSYFYNHYKLPHMPSAVAVVDVEHAPVHLLQSTETDDEITSATENLLEDKTQIVVESVDASEKEQDSHYENVPEVIDELFERITINHIVTPSECETVVVDGISVENVSHTDVEIRPSSQCDMIGKLCEENPIIEVKSPNECTTAVDGINAEILYRNDGDVHPSIHRDDSMNQPAIASSPSPGWECLDCTFVNRLDRPGCEICSSSRPDKGISTLYEAVNGITIENLSRTVDGSSHEPAIATTPPPGWECLDCTFFNRLERPGCETCSSARPDVRLPTFSLYDVDMKNVENLFHTVGEVLPLRKRSFDGSLHQPASPPPGWRCLDCTFVNRLDRPGCEMCSAARPDEKIPTFSLYEQLTQQISDGGCARTTTSIECPVCFAQSAPGDGCILSGCLHAFCAECIVQTVLHCAQTDVQCPFASPEYQCECIIADGEKRALLSAQQYEQHVSKSLREAELRLDNSFHCKTPNCCGWCTYDDFKVVTFQCPICNANNCIPCAVSVNYLLALKLCF